MRLLFLTLLTIAFAAAIRPERWKPLPALEDTYVDQRLPYVTQGSQEYLKISPYTKALISYKTTPPQPNPALPARLDPSFTEGLDPARERYLAVKLRLHILEADVTSAGPVKVSVYPTDDFQEDVAQKGIRTGPLAGFVTIANGFTGFVDVFVTQSVQNSVSSFVFELSEGSGTILIASKESVDGVSSTMLSYEPAVAIEPENTGCVWKTEIALGVEVGYFDCPYSKAGPAPVDIYVFHGAPTNPSLWRNLVGYLQQVGRVILPALPGSPGSGKILNAAGVPYGPYESAWVNEVGQVMLAFVKQLNSTFYGLIGQDYGGGAATYIELNSKPEHLAFTSSLEGVFGPSILCSPASEAAGTCFLDGIGDGKTGFGRFGQKILIEDVGGTGGWSEVIGLNNWFYNDTQLFDPRVFSQTPSPYYMLPGSRMGGVSPFLLALPFPGYRDVIETIGYDFQPPELAGLVYHKFEYMDGSRPIDQGLLNWPPCNAQHNVTYDSLCSAADRQLRLQKRAAYLPNGKLASVPKIFPIIRPGAVTLSSAEDLEWANGYYPSMYAFEVCRGAGHYMTEDGTCARDLGLTYAQLIQTILDRGVVPPYKQPKLRFPVENLRPQYDACIYNYPTPSYCQQ